MTETQPPDTAAGPEDPYDYCAAIAARNGSPLWLVGRALPVRKRRFFAAAYASMRVIDDYVDNTFLGLSPLERAARRPAALGRLASWQSGIEKAARGVAAEDMANDDPVFHALADILPHADLGIGPWQALGEAMRHDLEERPIEDWTAFKAYCDGATVAPAAVFIYILGCSLRADRFCWTSPQSPSYYASDIAVFCYLVHILRDLVADSKGDPQLLTIPRTVLSAASLSPSGLQAAIRHGDHAAVERLVVSLTGQAQAHRNTAERRIGELAEQIDTGPRVQLAALYGAYSVLHDRIREDPSSVLTDPEGLRHLQRTALERTMVSSQECP